MWKRPSSELCQCTSFSCKCLEVRLHPETMWLIPAVKTGTWRCLLVLEEERRPGMVLLTVKVIVSTLQCVKGNNASNIIPLYQQHQAGIIAEI